MFPPAPLILVVYRSPRASSNSSQLTLTLPFLRLFLVIAHMPLCDSVEENSVSTAISASKRADGGTEVRLASVHVNLFSLVFAFLETWHTDGPRPQIPAVDRRAASPLSTCQSQHSATKTQHRGPHLFIRKLLVLNVFKSVAVGLEWPHRMRRIGAEWEPSVALLVLLASCAFSGQPAANHRHGTGLRECLRVEHPDHKRTTRLAGSQLLCFGATHTVQGNIESD